MALIKTPSAPRQVRSTRAASPKRQLDREFTPGRCANLDYCTIGMQRVLLQVPLSEAFICPECGGPLRPPYGARPPGPRNWMPALRLGVLLGSMAVSLGAGYAIGSIQDRAAAAARAAAQNAGAGLAVAGQAIGLADPPRAAPPALPALVTVAERPYPAHAPGVDVTDPAQRLAHETRFGQVTIDCLLEPAAARPACQVSDIRGADAFSAQATAWLQSLDVRYLPGPHAGPPADHRWRVVLEDFRGTSRRTP